MGALIVFAYNLALLAGTAWLVGWCGWSPWWFLLTILALASYERRSE